MVEDDGEPADDADEGDTCWVWPEHVEALELFLRVSTQWRAAAGMRGVMYVGLDYAAVDARLGRALRGERREQLWEQLQVMELAAVVEMNARGRVDD